jgi:hypothetical protein
MAEEKKPKLLEKDIVDYVIEHWDEFFKEIDFFRREKTWLPGWRNDITATIWMDLKDYGFKEESYMYRAPIFIEAKFRSSSRDLIFELEKAKVLVGRLDWPSYIGVLSDDFSDPVILNYLIENKVLLWKMDITGDDLTTLKINFYEPHGSEVIEDVKL